MSDSGLLVYNAVKKSKNPSTSFVLSVREFSMCCVFLPAPLFCIAVACQSPNKHFPPSSDFKEGLAHVNRIQVV